MLDDAKLTEIIEPVVAASGLTLYDAEFRGSSLLIMVDGADGANLDRVQVIKGWLDDAGKTHEKVYDVAWSGDRKPNRWTGRVPAIRSTVDIEKATYTNDAGSAELKTVWTDPEFDASLHAFYYARVLEIPTPRWCPSSPRPATLRA